MIWRPDRFVLGMDAIYWLLIVGVVAILSITLMPTHWFLYLFHAYPVVTHKR